MSRKRKETSVSPPVRRPYYSIPAKWDGAALLLEHTRLNGTFPLATTPCHAFYGDGHISAATLWCNLADGIRAGDGACIELSVRFIEAHFMASYSGFARQRIARALRHAALSPAQKQRLSQHFLDMLEAHKKCQEFSAYLKLWPRIMPAEHRKHLQQIIQKNPVETLFCKRLQWVVEQSEQSRNT